MEEDVITNMTVITNKHSYQFDLNSLPPDKSGNIYVAKFVYDKNKKPGPIIDSLLPSSMIPPERSGAPSAMPTSSPFGVGPSIPGAQPAATAPQPMLAQPQVIAPEPAIAPAAIQPMPSTSYPQASPAPAAAQSGVPATASTVSGTNYSYTYAGPDELAPLQVYDDGHATYLKYRDVKKLPPNVYVVDKAGRESAVSYTVKGDYMVLDVVAGELALKSSDSVSVVHVFNEMLNPG
jgi:type IV secretory pathway VirB9-like protein